MGPTIYAGAKDAAPGMVMCANMKTFRQKFHEICAKIYMWKFNSNGARIVCIILVAEIKKISLVYPTP